MDKIDLINQIEKYKPYNEKESFDKEIILDFLKNNKDAFSRENKLAHMTSSSWIVNKDRTKVLMVYHNIYNSWSWTGGHADNDEDLLYVALKEASEETGLNSFNILSNDIFSIEILTVDGHFKKNKYVNSHLHFNVTYLLEANENDTLIINENENKGVQWIAIDDLDNKVNEKWMKENIYSKLNAKLKKLFLK